MGLVIVETIDMLLSLWVTYEFRLSTVTWSDNAIIFRRRRSMKEGFVRRKDDVERLSRDEAEIVSKFKLF